MPSAKPTVLIIDDEPAVLRLLTGFIERRGFDVLTRAGGRAGLDVLRKHKADLVLVDLRMPDVGGLDVLRNAMEQDPQCRVVLITGNATVETAVEAVKLGAMDYLAKPFDFDRLGQLLDDLMAETDRRRKVLESEAVLAKRLEFCGMIGRGPAMQTVFSLVRRLAPHMRTVLISGETGTGKELVASALHSLGSRRARKLVTINCSAVVETLFESELFGHVRGAFTGATDNKMGLFEVASGGTLFLDEVGELPLAVQAKLLRVLECGEVQRVGSLEARRVDVQVIAATNRDLAVEVEERRFRSDLFYRLNVIGIELPPLRHRREDIPYLTAAFVREHASRMHKEIGGLTPDAERLLATAEWPGNVRELRNVIERACILADREFITERELQGGMRPAVGPRASMTAPPVAALFDGDVPGAVRSLADVERDHIVTVLDEAGGNKSQAARALGVSRRAFYRRLERYRLERYSQP